MTVVDTDVVEIESSQDRLRSTGRSIVGADGRGEPSEPLSRLAPRYPVFVLAALAATGELQVAAVALLGPEIGRTLGMSNAAVGLLAVVQSLVLVGVALPVAAFVQRGRRRARVAISAAVAVGVCVVLSAFVTAPAGLLAAALVAGVAGGAARATHTPLVVDTCLPAVRVRALSVYSGGASLGVALAPVVVAVAGGALGLTWRGVLLVCGLGILAVAAGASRLRDPGAGRLDAARLRAAVRDDSAAAGPTDPGADEEVGLRAGEVVRRLLLVPTVRLALTAQAFLGMLVVPLPVFLSFRLDDRWDMGLRERSLFGAAVYGVAVVALAVAAPRGERAFRRAPSALLGRVAIALAVAAGGAVIAGGSPVLASTFAGFAVAVSGVVISGPALAAVVFAVVPARARPHYAALSAMFLVGAGGVVGSLVLGAVDRRFGSGTAVVVLAVPALVAARTLQRASRVVDADLDRMIDDVVETEEIRILERTGRHLPMLACRRIDFAYGQLQVLFDVDFTVDDGEMVALLGTNGAGKSTLLRVISGLGPPSRGNVTFRGADITYLDAERRLGLGITQIPGGNATFGPLTVIENLRVYGHSLGPGARALDRGIDATFAAFPRLGKRRNQLASTLSGGEQQMLALGKAFILQPRLLLIDELSLGLAPKVVGELLDMVRRINATGTAVVLVEQSVNIALSLVDHAYFMEKGEIRFDGRAADLLDRPDLLRSVFLEGATKGLG
jgi:ABC-type branched-subunit amino acid transport system ATPase component/MFS family permease